jgi:hypothetical protein
MTELTFEPRLRADGILDPESLERVGLVAVTDWMRERLSGRDPWVPIDRRSDEDPEALIVATLRGLGSGHPVSSLLARAARQLLEEASAASPVPPAYFRPLLRLCQQTALPATASWFVAEITSFAEQPEEFVARWPEDRFRNEILFAALRQSPGWPGSPSRSAWETLLSRPESATQALSTLGTSLEQQAAHLAVWWRACPPDDRDLELSQLIFEALTTEGEESVRIGLSRVNDLPPDLQSAINRELRANGARSLFASAERRASRIPNSLKNAGLKREYMNLKSEAA